ncbi:hypothetical protein KW801_01095, partial [Candidatus Saccharibacteria bacterium]|nr:hypothetical protein [Candidatus Saccharibacteria bacterium]
MHQSEPAGWFWSAGANTYVYRHHVHRRHSFWRRYSNWLKILAAVALTFLAISVINNFRVGTIEEPVASAQVVVSPSPPPVEISPVVAASSATSQPNKSQQLL